MREISDAELVVREGVHQSKSQRIRQCKKDLHGFGGRLSRREASSQLLHLLRLVNVWQSRSHT